MLRDFVIETVSAPGTGATITLPNVAPAGRITWAAAFGASTAFVFYVLDDSVQQEWGVGALTLGSPNTIARPAIVLGNSAGTTARLNFANATRCYSGLPSAASLSALGGNTGRNLFHNAMDRIQQRGAGPFTAVGYTTDRWLVQTGTAGGTRSIAPTAINDAARAQIGDEEAEFALSYTFSGGAGAGDLDVLCQRIEDLRRTANRLVTISFYAIATVGVSLGVSLTQIFGSGGSPSANVIVAAQVVTLTTAWKRFSLTFAVPSVSGKTFGTTAGTDSLQANFWLSSGVTNNAQAGSIGVQADTVRFFGRQCEIGAVATPLEKQDIRYDLTNCQRFAQIMRLSLQAPAIGFAGVNIPFPVPMRAAPTLTNLVAGTATSASVAQEAAVDNASLFLQIQTTAISGSVVNRLNLYSADL